MIVRVQKRGEKDGKVRKEWGEGWEGEEKNGKNRKEKGKGWEREGRLIRRV